MPLYRVQIDPLDPLLFGDSRSARAGLDHLQRDQDPSPLTIHGALGQHVLEACGGSWPCPPLGVRQDDVLDPSGEMAELLGFTYRGAEGQPLFPKPLHLRCRRSKRGRLLPVDLLAPAALPTKARASSQAQWEELFLAPEPAGDEEPDEYEGDVWISEAILREVLCGRAPSSDVGLYLENHVYRPEGRPGIAVDNRTGRVFEGAFFTRPYRRFRPPPLDPRNPHAGAGMTAWLRTLEPVPESSGDTAFLGGDRRRARLCFEKVGEQPREVLPDLLAAVVRAAEEERTRGFVLVLLTPAIQEPGVPVVEDLEPVAAVQGKPSHVSGWDVRARQPRPLLALVPAGSCFFYRWPSAEGHGELVRRLWLQAFRRRGAAVGFGRCLVGVWR